MQSTTSPPCAVRLLHLSDRVLHALGLVGQPVVNLEQLQHCPPNSLGQMVVAHFTHHQIQPFTTGLRRKQLHDVVHVLTGYGTDPIGELEVQAFLLGAKLHPANLVISLGLFRLVWSQGMELTRSQLHQRFQAAYKRGHQANFDPDTWQPEQSWSTPLNVVQDYYGV